jgi:ribosomal protein L37E
MGTVMPGKKHAVERRAPWCKRCGRRIYVPKGWSAGPAARRHYWRKHPEVMRKGHRRAAR